MHQYAWGCGRLRAVFVKSPRTERRFIMPLPLPLRDTAIRPSVRLSAPALGAQLPWAIGTLAACSLAMCGLRTRPQTDVDPPRVELPSAVGGISSRRLWGNNCFNYVMILHYWSEQHLANVSLKVASFCQIVSKCIFKSILQTRQNTHCTMPPPHLSLPPHPQVHTLWVKKTRHQTLAQNFTKH